MTICGQTFTRHRLQLSVDHVWSDQMRVFSRSISAGVLVLRERAWRPEANSVRVMCGRASESGC